MPFLTRNRYYLRVSSSKTIPLYVGFVFVPRLSVSEGLHDLQVYLDSQHVDWMSDQILRKVVADLRPKWEMSR